MLRNGAPRPDSVICRRDRRRDHGACGPRDGRARADPGRRSRPRRRGLRALKNEPGRTGADGADDPWREDLVASLLATALVAGLFVDGWNHIKLQDGALGSVFTVWHALLYAGFTATALWVVTRNPHLYDRRSAPKPYFHPVRGVPLRYPLAVAGLVIATVGLMGDVIWHTAFGEERGVARVIAPFHLLLFAGAAGLVSAPLRSGWYAQRYYPKAPSLGRIFPPLLSLTLVTCVAAFMFQWLSAFIDWTPSVQIGRIPPELANDERIQGTTEFAGVARVLVTNVILLAPLLLALRHWSLPFGSATFLFVVVAASMGALSEFAIGGSVLAAAGIPGGSGGHAARALDRLLPGPSLVLRRRLALRSVARDHGPGRSVWHPAELRRGPPGHPGLASGEPRRVVDVGERRTIDACVRGARASSPSHLRP